MENEGVAVATIIGMIAIPATAHRGIIKFIGHFLAAASVAVNVSSQAYRSVAFNSAFTFRTTALYQIAYCRIILRMTVIAQGPAYLSSISQYKMIVSKISRWPHANEGDFGFRVEQSKIGPTNPKDTGSVI